jgi:peptidoglycan/xylan/chitin deacetylase (PgdA/CDA1 family)
VIEVHAQGIEIAAHSHQHAPLDVLPAAQANFEVVHCKQILEERLGVQVASFAYPYGYYSAAVQRMVETAGYSSACAVRYRRSGVKDDVFALSRLIVPGMMELSQFTELLHACAAQINPHYERLRARLWQWARSGRQALQQVSQGSPNYEARSL